MRRIVNKIILCLSFCLLFCPFFHVNASAAENVHVVIPVEMEDEGGMVTLVSQTSPRRDKIGVKAEDSGKFELDLPYGDYVYYIHMEQSDAEHVDDTLYVARIMAYIDDDGNDAYTLILHKDGSDKKCESCSFRNYNDKDSGTAGTSGSGKGASTKDSSRPQTGDNSGIGFWFAMAAVSAGCIVFLAWAVRPGKED